MCYDKLEKQKEVLLKERKLNVLLLVMGSLMLAFFLWAAILDVRAVFLLLFPIACIVLAVKDMVEVKRVLTQFSSIVEHQSLNKTYEVVLHHPKLAFRRCPEIRAHHRLAEAFYAITLTDQSRKKYYYFLQSPMRYDDKAGIAKLRQTFSDDVRIHCYESTTIIKTVEKDMRPARAKSTLF